MYYKYSECFKKKYGAKTYKLPINLPITCPNRIYGTGCTIYADIGTGFESQDAKLTVINQLSIASFTNMVEISISVFNNREISWWKFIEEFEEDMKQHQSFQGKCFDYTNGSALRKGGYLDE